MLVISEADVDLYEMIPIQANCLQLKLQHSAQWDDMSVLEPLCKRNHSQHRRTDYFARVSAVLRCGNMHRQSKVAESWKLLASVIRDVSDADGMPLLCSLHPYITFHDTSCRVGDTSSSKHCYVPIVLLI